MKDQSTPPTELESLIRSRRFVRSAFALGIFASLAANVLHAEPNIISRVISAWPPIALIITVDMISRVRARSSAASFIVRTTATSIVAGIAAWVSYWHMAAVAREYGETADAAHLIPFSVDGMIVVASIYLVEIGRRLHVLQYGEEPRERHRRHRATPSPEAVVEAPESAADAPNDIPRVMTPATSLDVPTPRSEPRKRSLSSHADCDHENTRAARAACRRGRADSSSTNDAAASYDITATPTEGNSDEPARRPGKVDQGPARWLSGHQG